MEELMLSQIWIYPIKSLGGISLNSCRVMKKGLELDRRYMLVDETGTAMTQRTHPTMALFKVILRDGLHIEYGDSSLDIITIPQHDGASVSVQIWDDSVSAVEANEDYSSWFTRHLGKACKLVYFPEENPRPVNPKYKVNDEHVSLADAYPFLIIGQSSLDDLNTRLEKAVPMNRFRPNFVFTGGVPYEEDKWRNFSIGDNRFIGVKPSDRCVMTTVDQKTAQKGAEPLKTLAGYRKIDNKIYFGQNAVALDHHIVRVGDTIRLQ
jgi:uncharacterized protein YcbX